MTSTSLAIEHAVALEAPPRRAGRQRAGWRWVLSTGALGALWFGFFAAHVESWSTTRRPVGAGAVVVECVFAVLFVCRRQPLTVSRAPIAWLAAAVGSFGILAARPHYAPLGNAWVPALLQLGGAAGAVLCLCALGRSFGIVAADRGLSTSGPYRLVRHPLYACYLVVFAGYVLENPSLRNLVVVSAVTSAQLVRINEEERCLLANPGYRRYVQRVRRRLVPYLY